MEEIESAVENRLNELILIEMQLEKQPPLSLAVDKDFELIFFIPEGVRLYTIEGSEASALTDDSSLQFLLYPPDYQQEGTSDPPQRALIQVGTWLYPLAKDVPVLASNDGNFLVLNPTPENPNLAVGIVLTSEVDSKQAAEFARLLGDYSDLRELVPDGPLDENSPRNGKSDRIMNYLVSGGEKLAGKIQKKAAQWNKRLEERGEKYRQTTQPKEEPTQVPQVVKGGVVYMHKGTKTVAKFGEKVFEKLSDLGQAVGKKVAVGATKIMENSETAEKSIKVVGGGVAAVGSVFFSLILASKTLGKQFSTQTVQNVRHKHGEEASNTAKHALHAAGHGGMFALQITQANPQALIGRVGMGVGVKTVTDLHENLVGEPIPIRIPGLVPPAPVQEVIEVERVEATVEKDALEPHHVDKFQIEEVLVHEEEKKLLK